MGFRFRRSIRLLPGIRLNIGKRGVSTSVGVRGAHVTVGHGQVRETVGLPGTGLSYTHVEKAQQDAPGPAPAGEIPKGRVWRGWLWIGLISAVIACILGAAIVAASAVRRGAVEPHAMFTRRSSLAYSHHLDPRKAINICRVRRVSSSSKSSKRHAVAAW
jgi:hypothetical protein